MTQKKAITNEDILNAVTDFGSILIGQVDELGNRLDERIDGLGDRLDGRIDSLGTRMERMGHRMTDQAIAQRETNTRLGSIENRLGKVEGEVKANGNDIKELYLYA